jgi:DNA polymerase-3 subunit epsilon
LKTQNKFWFIIAVALSVTSALLCTVGLMFWYGLTPGNQQYLRTMVIDHFAYFFSAGFLLLIATGFAADWIYRAYVKPINRMSEQIDLINTVNPNLRVSEQGSHDVRRLARIINQSAELVAGLQKSHAAKLTQAQSEIETEEAILATLLSDLPQGILVCNLEGRIVFYNRKVKTLLVPAKSTSNERSASASQWVGLGRSVYDFIDRTLIQDALARITGELTADRSTASERFLVGTGHNAALPAELLPVLDSQHHVTGFIINIEDRVSKMRRIAEESKHLQFWRHQLTQYISVIKTVAEVLRDEAFKSDQEYRQLVQILAEQSDLAAEMWTQKKIADKWCDTGTCPLTPITVEKWGLMILQQVSPLLNLDLKMEAVDGKAHISIDIHHLTQSLVHILKKIKHLTNISAARAHFYKIETWLYVDIIWKGQGVSDDALKKLKADSCGKSEYRQAIAISSILMFHGAKLWPYRGPGQIDNAGLRLLIPTLEHAAPVIPNGRVTILPESRPEFYDFNMFQQAGQSPDLDSRLLSELTYTVFDTETTGLDPSEGDEIISIGALRIVNGRLLKQEQFSQLIDPRRHLPWESIKFHGIRPEMLVDQPTIEKVLPRFKDFVQDTILVGHNAAFDMRMLQLKEELTGVRFINPVLDTMLLSSVLHPAQEDHSLGAIAQRLGVKIVGRHTAMGDALATAEIFLILLSLLSKQGVKTFLDACEASKTSYYARLKY